MLPRIIVVKEVGSSFLQMMATSKLETTCIAIVIEKVLKAKQFEVKTTFEFKRFFRRSLSKAIYSIQVLSSYEVSLRMTMLLFES